MTVGQTVAVRIDPEFRALIPPLSPEEREQLELNLKADGCREPLAVWNEAEDSPLVIDGHNRHEICTRNGIEFGIVEIDLPDREAVKDWIDKNQIGRRNLNPDQMALIRGRRYNRLKKEQHRPEKRDQNDPVIPERTAERLSREHGVSPATIKRDAKAAKLLEQHPQAAQRIIEGKAKIRRTVEAIQRETRQEKRREAAKAAPSIDERIIIGDFRKHADKVVDGSVSLIFTDPPYDREASKMLPALGEFAATKLADGGSLILYVGQTQIPAALDALRVHLRYWWTIACVHSGRKTVMREYGINAGWKAVLWFVKGTRDDNSVMVNDVMSGGEEKSHHDWQQAQSEAEYWIDKLCPSDGLVCDPFLGGGTTAAAAKSKARKWIGFEIDNDTAAIASSRIGA